MDIAKFALIMILIIHVIAMLAAQKLEIQIVLNVLIIAKNVNIIIKQMLYNV